MRLGRSADGPPAEVVASLSGQPPPYEPRYDACSACSSRARTRLLLAALAKLHWSEAHQTPAWRGVEGLESGVLDPERPNGYGHSSTRVARRSTLARPRCSATHSRGSSAFPAPRRGLRGSARPRLRGVGRPMPPAIHGCCARALRISSPRNSHPAPAAEALEGSGFDRRLWRALGRCRVAQPGLRRERSRGWEDAVDLGNVWARGSCPDPSGRRSRSLRPCSLALTGRELDLAR